MFTNKPISIDTATVLVVFLMLSLETHAQERSWEYTYNESGQRVSQDGPRQDVNDTSTFTYDSDGNLSTIENALGHTIIYQDYNSEGFPLSITDENGVTRELTYNWRGKVTESIIKDPSGIESRDKITTYEYDSAGNLVGVTHPGKSTMRFEYDTAGRLIALIDDEKNRIEYTLDDSGNRIEETILNSSGTITYSIKRSFDALDYLTDVTGNNAQHIHLDRDANGNNTVSTDGKGNSTQSAYDALDRVSQLTDPAAGETSYTYNSRDQITSVTDPTGLVTSYEYDGLGNLVRVTSPDTGTTTYSYDQAGNRTSSTDARGISAEYRYDALNRLVEVRYGDHSEYDVQYHYDQTEDANHGTGRLTGVSDASGHTAYRYDPLGNVVEKQVTVDGLTLAVQYQYDELGKLAGITYPSGRQVQIERDSQGRPEHILTKETLGSSPQPLMENARYLPFGPLAEYMYGNGLIHQRTHDQDYRLTQLNVGTTNRLYEYDPVNNITGVFNPQDSGDGKNFSYDSLNRLTDALSQDGLLSYSYDPVGNRTEYFRDGDVESYLYGPDSHQLEARDTAQYQYDAAGNTVDDGEYRFRYSASNRLIEVLEQDGNTTIAEYLYNAQGQRVLKRVGGATPDYMTLAQENEARAEQHRQTAQGTQAQAQNLVNQAENQRAEAHILTNQADPLREQADTERALAEQHTAQAEQLEGAAVRLTDEAANLRSRIVEPAGSFWERLQNSAYAAAADAAEGVAVVLNTEAGNQRTEAELRLVDANNLDQQAEDLDAQANSLIAAAQNAEAEAQDLQDDVTNLLAQAEAAEAQAQEYRQLAGSATLEEARQTVYLYNETGQLIGEYDETGATLREYIYHDTAPLALATDSQIYFYHNDHLATPKLLTDTNQNVVWQARHTPFGKADIQVEQISNNLRFPGQYFDQETGLHYNYFRDYDPETGRYLQSDPIGLEGGLNTYAYVEGNPLSYVDPEGLAPLCPPGQRAVPTEGFRNQFPKVFKCESYEAPRDPRGEHLDNLADFSGCMLIGDFQSRAAAQAAKKSAEASGKKVAIAVTKKAAKIVTGPVGFVYALYDCGKKDDCE